MQKQKEPKQDEIIFNQEIDGRINGFALVLAFIVIGLFLTFYTNYFGNLMISNIIRWVFISIGILGFLVEFPKIIKDKIKGTNGFILGIIFLSIWAVCFISLNIWFINLITFFFLVFGLFGSFKGAFEMIYSFWRIHKEHKENKGKISADVLLIISYILGIALVIIQLVKALDYKNN